MQVKILRGVLYKGIKNFVKRVLYLGTEVVVCNGMGGFCYVGELKGCFLKIAL